MVFLIIFYILFIYIYIYILYTHRLFTRILFISLPRSFFRSFGLVFIRFRVHSLPCTDTHTHIDYFSSLLLFFLTAFSLNFSLFFFQTFSRSFRSRGQITDSPSRSAPSKICPVCPLYVTIFLPALLDSHQLKWWRSTRGSRDSIRVLPPQSWPSLDSTLSLDPHSHITSVREASFSVYFHPWTLLSFTLWDPRVPSDANLFDCVFTLILFSYFAFFMYIPSPLFLQAYSHSSILCSLDFFQVSKFSPSFSHHHC